MAPKGAKRVRILGLEDKRQVTATFGAAMSGDRVPTQLIYEGKTDRCLPAEEVRPEGWCFSYSENHWSNAELVVENIEETVAPYVNLVRCLADRPNLEAVLLLDMFRGNTVKSTKRACREHGLIRRLIPA
eukprot:gene7426-9277_t